ncbi:F0F1 ATP synthase subunit delta [Bacteroidia bacterium]|nr:F0F1 ATP synthase subunit delta [Bacteroidia bacterium]
MISTRYARAIYAFAAEKSSEDAVYREMKLLIHNFSAYPVLRKVMSDPTVSSNEKIKLLTTACGIQVGEVLKHIVRTVVENGRANQMENIALMYGEVYKKAKGIVSAQLTTVEPAGEKIKAALIKVISNGTSENVEFQTHTDPELIGGFVLEVGDQRLDASVKDQLRRMRYEF